MSTSRDLDGLEPQAIINIVSRPVARGRVPGIAGVLAAGGERIGGGAGLSHAGQNSPFDEATRLPLACLMKPLLALACAELQVQGALDMFAPLSHYLPELSHPSGDPTIAQLLSHTGGFIEPQDAKVRWSWDWDDFTAFFTKRHQAFPPGAVWSYTQTGHVVVGRIIDQIVGVDPLQLIIERILLPLGINIHPEPLAGRLAAAHVRHRDTFAPIKLPQQSPLLATSLSPLPISVLDIATLGRLLGGSVLPPWISEAAYKLFSTPIVSIPAQVTSSKKEATPSAYGFGLAWYGDLVGQSGSFVGTTLAVRANPATDRAAAVGINLWAPNVRDGVLSRLMALLDAPPTRSMSKTSLPIRPPAPLSFFSGRYKALLLGCGEAHIAWDGGVLDCRFSGVPEARFRLRLNELGDLTVIEEGETLAISFELTAAGEPFVFAGMSAYKRIGNA